MRDSVNYRLGFWTLVNGNGFTLASDVLREDIATVGSSTITVTFIDSITRAEFNITYPFTILEPATYYNYLALGTIT